MSETANKPAKKEPKPKKSQEFEVVYFLALDDIRDTTKVQALFMPKKFDGDGAVIEPEEGAVVRLFPTSETAKSGYSNGIWGSNVQRLKMELAIWAMGATSAKGEEHKALGHSFFQAEQDWAEFISTL